MKDTKMLLHVPFIPNTSRKANKNLKSKHSMSVRTAILSERKLAPADTSPDCRHVQGHDKTDTLLLRLSVHLAKVSTIHTHTCTLYSLALNKKAADTKYFWKVTLHSDAAV
jgi:hypothetical protein